MSKLHQLLDIIREEPRVHKETGIRELSSCQLRISIHAHGKSQMRDSNRIGYHEWLRIIQSSQQVAS